MGRPRGKLRASALTAAQRRDQFRRCEEFVAALCPGEERLTRRGDVALGKLLHSPASAPPERCRPSRECSLDDLAGELVRGMQQVAF